MIVAVAGVAGFILWRAFGPRGQSFASGSLVKPPTFVDRARDEVERVHLEAEVEKATVRAEAAGKLDDLKVIEAKANTDPKQARKELAEFLAANL